MPGQLVRCPGHLGRAAEIAEGARAEFEGNRVSSSQEGLETLHPFMRAACHPELLERDRELEA
jgi:hypothetical protein